MDTSPNPNTSNTPEPQPAPIPTPSPDQATSTPPVPPPILNPDATPHTPPIGISELEYIDSINAPIQPVRYKLWKDPTVIKVVVAAVSVILITIIASAIINSQSGRSGRAADTLRLRIETLSAAQSEYGGTRQILSTELRRISTLIGSSLHTANRNLTPFLETLGVNPDSPASNLVSQEATIRLRMLAYLEDAQISGHLDRSFATLFQGQIYEILNLLTELDGRNTDNPALREFILDTRTTFQAINIELNSFIQRH